MIADLELDGKERHVVMQAPKNGFFYILDAATGELISANPFAKQNWTTGVDMKTGRPHRGCRRPVRQDGQAFNMLPGPAGAHAWQPMAYSPETGYVYIPATDMWNPVRQPGQLHAGAGQGQHGRQPGGHPSATSPNIPMHRAASSAG